ncbi:MAG: DUF429 domain-containing protein [candidate division NC10 bacterium]|nr:DUF429 domain-containing protein [candidate division NC10 bacterium]
MRIVGIDLAWGERKPDGVAWVEVDTRLKRAELAGMCSSTGNQSLLRAVETLLPASAPGLVALDGPILCRNLDGARPVDIESHRLYGRYHAGCHPANLRRHRRPVWTAQRLRDLGFQLDHRLCAPRQLTEAIGAPLRRQIEVYPHPALVHLLNRERIIKYKRGKTAARAEGLADLQRSLFRLLPDLTPPVQWNGVPGQVFVQDPRALRGLERKRLEDRLDAIVCAIVGLLYWWHGGHPDWIEIPGDLQTGFIVVPRRTCCPWASPTPSSPPSTTG